MHTKETPNHHVRRATNHILLNIKRTAECPVEKQGFGKAPFSSQSPHFNKPCFYFGRGWKRAHSFMNTATNEIRFVPYMWLMADCLHWSMPSQPSGHCCCLWCPERAELLLYLCFQRKALSCSSKQPFTFFVLLSTGLFWRSLLSFPIPPLLFFPLAGSPSISKLYKGARMQ